MQVAVLRVTPVNDHKFAVHRLYYEFN